MRGRDLRGRFGAGLNSHTDMRESTKQDSAAKRSPGMGLLFWSDYFFACSKRLLTSSQFTVFHHAAR